MPSSGGERDGLAYPDLDPVYTANALSYMVDRFLYEWTVLDLDYDEDKAVETLSRLWVRSLGLEQPALRGPRGAAEPAPPAEGSCSCRPAATWRSRWRGTAGVVRRLRQWRSERAIRRQVRSLDAELELLVSPPGPAVPVGPWVGLAALSLGSLPWKVMP